MTKPFIKPIITPEEAAGKVREGTTVMFGGFNYGGVPYTVIDALHDQGTGDIRVICVDNDGDAAMWRTLQATPFNLLVREIGLANKLRCVQCWASS